MGPWKHTNLEIEEMVKCCKELFQVVLMLGTKVDFNTTNIGLDCSVVFLSQEVQLL